MQAPTIIKHKNPITVKISNWSARHRWLVFGLWFVFVIGLMFGASAIPVSDKAYDANAGIDFESAKAYDVLKADGGTANPTQDFFLVVTHPTLKPADAAFKSAVTDIYNSLKSFSITENGAAKPLFSQIVNPFEVPAEMGLISKDGTAVRIYGQIPSKNSFNENKQVLEPFEPKIKAIKNQYPDYTVLVSNTTLNWLDAAREGNESLMHSLLITLIPTFVILLLVFGALVAAVVPLVLAITAIIGAVGIVTAYSRISGNHDITQGMMLAVLMGLAVAVDYSLFIISRYRSERHAGRSKLAALEVANGTAGRAVFFSGVLVAISISGLFILGSLFIPMAIGVIAVVLMSVLGSITFLPALLSILGKGINWGRIPFFGREKEDGTGFWAAIVRGVMRRPLIVTVVASVLLIGLATPLLHAKLGFSESSSEKTEMEKVSKLMNAKWPQGTELRLQAVITQADKPETQAAIKNFEAALLQIPGLSGPAKLFPSRDGKVAMLSVYQSGSMNDDANHEIVRKVRQEVIPASFGSTPDVKVYVTGTAALVVDQIKFFMNPIVWVFVLGLSFVVLLLVFRSVVIPTKAIILNLFSTGAAYGAVILVFQDGKLWVPATGVMEAWLPVFVFAIVFGLSMDYHMFILTRIKELRDKGYSSNEAVAKGISSTSGTITGAAAIMVVVFGDFFVGVSDPSVQQLGLGLAVAVFLDATVVRCMLLPAVMRLMNEANWWMPKFLNWLPTITVESEPEEVVPAHVAEPEKELVTV